MKNWLETGNFKIGGERGTILKKLCPVEENCFQLLMQDPLRPFIPKYKGHIIADDGERNRLNWNWGRWLSNGIHSIVISMFRAEFLVLEDLLGEFSNPSVMDCKLGVRTYLEDELAKAKIKPKLRKVCFQH